MNGVIYIRVSTDDKDQNPDRQIEPILKYNSENNINTIKIIKEYYTGNSNIYERPGGKWIKDNWDKWDCLGVYDMSRFSREHPIKIFKYLEEFKNNNKKLIPVTQPAFNMNSEFSEIIIFIITWFNSYYLKELKRNTISGLEKARRDGKVLGRPKTTQETIDMINELRPNSINSISKQLGISRQTVAKYVK